MENILPLKIIDLIQTYENHIYICTLFFIIIQNISIQDIHNEYSIEIYYSQGYAVDRND